MSDIWICILCFLYVTAEVFAAFLLFRFAGWKSEYVRKFIHILTSLIIIPCEYCIDNPALRPLVPAAFIFINAFAVISGLIGPLGVRKGGRNLGLVLYPVAVTAVTAMEACGVIGVPAAVSAVLIMGCGDGAAAVAGTLWGKCSYTVWGKYRKSLEGSLAMAVVASLCVLIFTDSGVPYALICGLVMAAVENLSPSSVDNVSVPLAAAFLVELLETRGM